MNGYGYEEKDMNSLNLEVTSRIEQVERIGGFISQTGISKMMVQERALTENGALRTDLIEYRLLDCSCPLVKEDDLGGISQCCGKFLCKNHSFRCCRCGRVLCEKHRFKIDNNSYCRFHAFLHFLGF